MPLRQLQALIGRLRRVVGAAEQTGPSDAQLLERWVQLRDEAAFEVLLWRHGPLVLGVCRRLLRDAGDAEDAFQATFLTLLRKAASIRRGESVAGWLYRVAYRASLKASAARRASPGSLPDDLPDGASEGDVAWRDLRPVLDEEVNGLPLRYRTAFVLCCLQGKTNAEAAAELGCPVGTVLSRLSWARRRLRERLTKRGVAASAALLGVALTERLVHAAPAALVQATFRAGLEFASGAGGGAVSAKVLTLTQEVLRAMMIARLKTGAAVLAATLMLLGGGAVAYQSWAAERPGTESRGQTPAEPRPARAPAPQKPADAPPQKDYQDAPSQQEGVLLVVGTQLKDKEKCEPERLVEVKVGETLLRFRRLKVGDKVEAGQMLGLIDPTLALNDIAIREADLEAARADATASEKTRDEAMQRYKVLQNLQGRNPAAVTDEEMRGARITYERYAQEAVAKKANVVKAERELSRAQTILRTYEVRSGANGVVTHIFYRPGEAVRKFDAVVRIKVSEEDR